MRPRLRRSGGEEVVPGGWIRIPVPGDPFPLSMQVGPTQRVPAFIEHEYTEDGSLRTLAALRCPHLTPGVYDVRVYGASSPISVQITVV